WAVAYARGDGGGIPRNLGIRRPRRVPGALDRPVLRSPDRRSRAQDRPSRAGGGEPHPHRRPLLPRAMTRRAVALAGAVTALWLLARAVESRAGAPDAPRPAGAKAATADQPETPPSLLLVTLDTTRADHLGCYGARTGATPRIDALAREGTLFLDVLSPAPLTLVSHCSLMTGLQPRRHGVGANESFRLGAAPATLAERLSRAGWSTSAYVSSVVLDRITGIARGFARYDDRVRIGERSAFDYSERAASQTNAAV